MDNQHPSISVVMPAYNESARLNKAIQSIAGFLASQAYDWELIIVDDGSVDGTAELARKAAEADSRIRLVKQPKNQGKGAAVKRGVYEASKPLVVFTDADQATPIEELPKFIEAAATADVVIGSRYLKASNIVQKQPLSRRIVSRVGNLLIRFSLGLPYSDTQCGFKLLTRDAAKAVFDRLTIDRWGFDIELLVIARAHHLRILELPVTWHDGGESKLNAGKAALTTFRELMSIRSNLHQGRYE